MRPVYLYLMKLKNYQKMMIKIINKLTTILEEDNDFK
jgi:hypothetical protein